VLASAERWIDAGVFDRLHQLLLAELNAAARIDWSRAVMEGSHIDAKKGALTQVHRPSIAVSPAASTTSSATATAPHSRC
jgi:hypothetical protein